ncbi:LysM peptidoglycan-binding domain-containing protein [Streptomyces gamaensis]|uniref:LysM peptidoglycan-binding domain-containing protein n=1 Tax=Streptomyces gamaensis TaxID=1763542 RepID=A0ABW0Z0C1_9ACTN
MSTSRQGLASGSPSSRQFSVVVRGDSLQSIAAHSTGRATDWRQIAELNGIDDPSKVRPGTVLVLPNATD